MICANIATIAKLTLVLYADLGMGYILLDDVVLCVYAISMKGVMAMSCESFVF